MIFMMFNYLKQEAEMVGPYAMLPNCKNTLWMYVVSEGKVQADLTTLQTCSGVFLCTTNHHSYQNSKEVYYYLASYILVHAGNSINEQSLFPKYITLEVSKLQGSRAVQGIRHIE